MKIMGSKFSQNLMAIRIPVPTQFIATLKTTNSLLPPTETQSFNERRGQTIRHYGLWAAYSNHAYKSPKFVDDREAGRACWSKIHLYLNIWVYFHQEKRTFQFSADFHRHQEKYSGSGQGFPSHAPGASEWEKLLHFTQDA